MDDRHSIAAAGISATVLRRGAELCSLRAPEELLWQAAPIWPRHSPILFPIVGRLAGDTLRVGGQEYPMTQHGFARDRDFTWIERETSRCVLALSDDAETRRRYPFAFTLRLTYSVSEAGLSIDIEIDNPGATTLPASYGLHPAFAWPLRPGLAKTDHRIDFAAPETQPIRRLDAGLLRPEAFPSPIDNQKLRLDEALFADDAIIIDRLASTAVRYTAPDAPVLDFAWHGFAQLGLWTKPADFICIEPWHGHADPVGFTGDVFDKPGMARIPPGGTAQAGLRISIK